MQKIREYSQSFFIWIMFGALVVVFAVSFGPGSTSCADGPATDYAARVNGEVIRRQEFALLLKAREDSIRRSLGPEQSAEMIARMGLRTQVIDQLIEGKLLEMEARRRGLDVSDEDLLAYLKTRFGVDQVDYQDYKTWVGRTFDTTVDAFEQEVRGDMVAEQLAEFVRDQVTVGEAEVKAGYDREHDRAQIWFVKYDPSAVPDPAPSDAEIDQLLAADAEAAKARYEQDKLLYAVPKEVHAWQILKKLGAEATESEVTAAKEALLALRTQVLGGGDFAQLAKQQSEDDQGGDLGWVKRMHLASELGNKLFEMRSDEVSDEPVRTPQGLHLLYVQEIKPPREQPFEEVQRQVGAAVLKDQRAEATVTAQGQALIAALASKALETLTRAADGADVTLPLREETAWFDRAAAAIPRLGVNDALRAAIFAADSGTVVDKPYRVGRHVYVVGIKDRERPDAGKYEGEKEDMKRRLVNAKRDKVYRSWVKHLRDQATVTLNPTLFGDV
jgi:parvulin-like peptidyl-prolyl isomerase